MGFRIPAVVVSPYAKRGAVSHQLCGFESIIKLITYRFGLGSLTTRDAQARNIGAEHELGEPELRAARPARPGPDRVRPCTFGGGDVRRRPAARTRATSPRSRTWPSGSGSRPAPASPDEIFREPDSLQQSLTTGG